MTMQRLFKVNDLSICVNATIKTLPYNVWRDLTHCAFTSADLSLFGFDGYELYKFASYDLRNKAVEVLRGAMFNEATLEEWEQFIKNNS